MRPVSIRLLCLAAAAVLSAACLFGAGAFAEDLYTYDDGYYISGYDVDVTVNSDRTYDITETIRVYFNEERHGIIREIPTYASLEREVRIENVSVEGAEYSYDGYGTIKIGSADSTVTGEMTYVIRYTLWHYADPEPDHDYMYLNLIGTEWDTYIEDYDCTVRLPGDAVVENITLTGGYYSEKGSVSEYTYDPETGIIHVTPLRGLNAREGVTIDVEMEEGAFADAEKWQPDLIMGPIQASMQLDEYGLLTVNESFSVFVNSGSSVFIGISDYSDEQRVRSQHYTLKGPEGSKEGDSDYCCVHLYGCEGETAEAEVSYTKQYNVKNGQEDFTFLQKIYDGSYSTYSGPVELDILLPFGAEAVEVYDSAYSPYGQREDCTVTGSGKHWHVSADPAPENTDDLYVKVIIRNASFIADLKRPEGIAWLFCVIFAALTALFANRNRPSGYNPVPEFYPPDGLTPPEVGYFYKAKAEERDMAGMIYYWASKGLLTIRFGKKDSFTLLCEDPLPEYDFRSFETPLWNGLWGNRKEKKATKSDLEGRFYKKIEKAIKTMIGSNGGEGALVVKKTQKLGSFLCRWLPLLYAAEITVQSEILSNAEDSSLGSAAFIFSLLLINSIFKQSQRRVLRTGSSGPGIIIGNIWAAVKSLLVALIFAACCGGYVMQPLSAASVGLVMCGIAFSYRFIVRRTDYGYRVLEQVEGFRMFLETAEKERIEMLLESDPDYFYNILPYAQALGVTKKWVRKFDGILVGEPSWLTNSSGHSFTYTDYCRMESRINSCATSVPVSSGGGGGGFSGGSSGGGSFSSGGSSGGGSGGGGGSSW